MPRARVSARRRAMAMASAAGASAEASGRETPDMDEALVASSASESGDSEGHDGDFDDGVAAVEVRRHA